LFFKGTLPFHSPLIRKIAPHANRFEIYGVTSVTPIPFPDPPFLFPPKKDFISNREYVDLYFII